MSDLPAAGTYDIEGSHTHVGFAVKHFGLSKVRGEFQKVDGTITIASVNAVAGQALPRGPPAGSGNALPAATVTAREPTATPAIPARPSTINEK